MKISSHLKAGLLSAVLCGSMNLSATPVDVSEPQEVIPPNIITTANRPMLMLVASKHHLLFGPVYTDFEDLDGDGVIDTTFKPTFEYYGYFDASKCYAYDNNAGQFNPAALADKKPVTTGSATTKYSCPSNESYWSGNFLNWMTMTRMNIIRKMLYGGYRYIDTQDSTVLMGSSLVTDSHSFVKYYNGDDIRDYTPFSAAALTKKTGANGATTAKPDGVYAGLSMCVTGNADDYKTSQPVIRLVKGNVRFWSTVEWDACFWQENYVFGTFGPKLARFYSDSDKGNGIIKHEEVIPSRAVDAATYGTPAIGPDLNVRVKVCDSTLLGEERCQAFPPGSTTNFKPYGLLQEFGYPRKSGEAARAEFGLISGSYDNTIDVNNFNSVIGVAGALRKNMGDLEDEIDRKTGIFCHNLNSGCLPSPGNGPSPSPGIIKTFDAMTLYSREYHNFTSNAAWLNPLGEMLVQALQYYSYDGTKPTPNNPTKTTADSIAKIPVAPWRDPFADYNDRSKKYGIAACRPLNILAISSSTLSYDGQAATPFLTLPGPNAGLDSFVDKIGAAEHINGTPRSVGSVPGNDDMSCSAKMVTNLSSVRGICPEAPAMQGSYQIAGAALYGNTTQIRQLPSPPSDHDKVENFLKVRTLAASLAGGAPRIDIPVPVKGPAPNPPLPQKYVSVTPESVQDEGKPNAPLTFVSISSGPTYGAFIVTWNDYFLGRDYDMDITGFLRYDLIENLASPSGWDIKITTDIPNVCGALGGTHGFSIIGVNKNGRRADGRYLTHQHGAAHYGRGSPILSNMPPPSQYLCGDYNYRNKKLTDRSGKIRDYSDTVCHVTAANSFCSVQDDDFLYSIVFNMVGETDALIKDPLWYAGKYGSFKSSVRNVDGTYTTIDMPPTTTNESWDNIKADGSIGPDGVPDGYFLARRPELLEAQLRKALDVSIKNSNSAPALASGQLMGNGYKYVAKFDSTAVTGELEAYKVDSNGEFSALPEWEAGRLLKASAGTFVGSSPSATANTPVNSGTSTSSSVRNDRNIITNDKTQGLQFSWKSLSTSYKEQMTKYSTNVLLEENAKLALDYVRGDQSQEGPNGLRERGDNLLGPVVNAAPWIQGRPSATLAGIGKDGYGDFFKNHKDRAKLLWVAANDGMLHAFNPDTGAEVFAYVPGALANRLAEIPLQRGTTARTKLNQKDFVQGTEKYPPGTTVWPYVDGSPFSADVKVGKKDWKTYVFGTLGRGGKGVFALDATDVTKLTQANAESIFKWEFTSDNDEDLGYITADVSIHSSSNQALPVVKMNNGQYALLLGNGNKSKYGKAVLFILYVDGPAASKWNGHYKSIVAGSGPDNGLSAPRWEDIDGDGTADVAYAGDLKGNLWKFDLASTNPDEWAVAFKTGANNAPNRPLHTAIKMIGTKTELPLPITTAPQLLYMGKGGFMVNFATGNAFGRGDFPDTKVNQRVYGIWDRPGLGSPARALPVDLSTLVQRIYARTNYGGSIGEEVTIQSSTLLDWSKHNGWYMDLPTPGEAVLSDPLLDAGILTFVTVRPGSSTNTCSATPDAALYTIDPISGQTERKIQGSSMDGSTVVLTTAKDIGDQKVHVVSDRTKKPFTSKSCKFGDPGCVCVRGGPCTVAAVCGPGERAKRITGRSADAVLCTSTAPRLQWREIPGLRTDQ